MIKKISLKVLGKIKTEFLGDVVSIIATTINGEICILPDHIPVIAALNGILKIKLPNGDEMTFDSGIEKKVMSFLIFKDNACEVVIRQSHFQKTEKVA